VKSKGTFIGGMLLIAGSCVGAGMLALPIITGLAGFIPSVFSFLLAWGFMTLTGLVLVEVTSTFQGRVNIGSMAERAMGPAGRILSSVLYLFLFYSLLIAYISGSGSLALTSFSIPKWLGSSLFTLGFGILAYQGTRTVDYWNRLLMAGKIITYLGMVVLGFQFIKPALLMRSEPLFVLTSLPVLVIAFGYHNMIPTLMHYMDYDAKKVRQTILAGSLFALVIYLIWDIVVLGVVPAEGPWGLIESLKNGRQASDAVTGILGLSWVSTFAEGLALFALVSSCLAQTLALVHFFADAVKVKREKHETVPLCLLALVPPLVFGIIYPDIFIHALNFAGGICTVILFGILPVIMAWKARYHDGIQGTYQLFGGKKLLLTLLIVALFIFFFEIASMLHLTPHV
jgi:tyrosine-specific transport protein